MKIKHSLLIICILCFSLNLSSEQEFTEKIKEVESFIKAQMEVDKIPGVAIGIMKGNFTWSKGFGYSDLENKIPMKDISCFRIASISKPMTATAILQLVEKRTIKLEDEVQKYVPYFPRKNFPVTIHPLLGHLGGISHYRSYDELHIKFPKDTREAIEIFANFDLVAEPWSSYNYSSYGYNLLGAVIEGATKMPYEKYMKENIWQPLQMKNTFMDSSKEIIPNRVKGYVMEAGNLKNSEFVDMSSRFASGGIRSTVLDLLKFVKGLKTGKIISLSTLDKMFTSMVTKNGELTNYGYGWFVRPLHGHFIVYHTGSQQETRTFLAFLPKHDLAVSFACNLEGINPSFYGFRIIQILLDEPFNLTPYTGKTEEEFIISGISWVFNYGLSHYEKNGKAFTKERKELEKAFRYFNEIANKVYTNKNPQELRRIMEGIHPKYGQPYQKMGSFMAEVLKNNFGEGRLNFYYKYGPIIFFSDYIKISRSKKDFPEELRLNKELENLIEGWEKDWIKTLNDFTRTLFIGAFTNPKEIKKNLKKIFDYSKIYPDFSPQIGESVRKLYLDGKHDKALELAQLCYELYPESAICYISLANTYLSSGDIDSARKYYGNAIKAKIQRKALELSGLINYAEDFANLKIYDRANNLMSILLELFPKQPLLYEGFANLLIKQAKDYYEKALEQDPFKRSVRKNLKKLIELEREI